MKTLIQIRTNSKFDVNYENLNLVPKVELILIFQEPEYTVKKDSVVRGHKISETRIDTDINGVGDMISKLQALQIQLQTFQNLSGMLNEVIKTNTKPKDEV